MPKPFHRALCWIRRDLRLYDHCPLATACEQAEEVAIVFVFDTVILGDLKDPDDRRVAFIHRSLQEIDRSLQEHGSSLVVLHGDPIKEIPNLAKAFQAEAVFTGRDYEPSAIRRDAEVANLLSKAGRELKTYKDQVAFEAGEVLSGSGGSFKVYTPYAKAWRSRFDAKTDAATHDPDLSALAKAKELNGLSADWSLKALGFKENDLWLEPGEAAGRARLEAFAEKIADYGEDRDFPALDGTSGLSVHLRFGTVSIRDCVRHALAPGKGDDKWLSELIWREFYQDILAHNPHVVSEPYQAQYTNLQYPGLDEHWIAWREGKTGYPIVDAAMRCFNATGWMHNRLRMIVASFLTKDLLIDYRKGEAYFARYLLDFDLASNNGGWQWAASTGVDAQPYFRIFNPILQSKKFDPEGEFIRRWLPELKELPGGAIHWPRDAEEFDLAAAGVELGKTYPHPVVDHATQRDRAIKLLENARR